MAKENESGMATMVSGITDRLRFAQTIMLLAKAEEFITYRHLDPALGGDDEEARDLVKKIAEVLDVFFPDRERVTF